MSPNHVHLRSLTHQCAQLSLLMNQQEIFYAA